MIYPFPESFTILTRTKSGTDSDGNDVYSTVEVATSGAFAPAGSTEITQSRDTVIEHDTLYITDGQPAPKVVDRVRARGVVREVDSIPELFHNPFTGAEPGAVVRLVSVTG